MDTLIKKWKFNEQFFQMRKGNKKYPIPFKKKKKKNYIEETVTIT